MPGYDWGTETVIGVHYNKTKEGPSARREMIPTVVVTVQVECSTWTRDASKGIELVRSRVDHALRLLPALFTCITSPVPCALAFASVIGLSSHRKLVERHSL